MHIVTSEIKPALAPVVFEFYISIISFCSQAEVQMCFVKQQFESPCLLGWLIMDIESGG